MTSQENVRVLIAENDYLVSEMVRALLEELDYVVIGEAADGIEAGVTEVVEPVEESVKQPLKA